MDHSSELPIKPIIMVVAYVLLEIVAGDDTVGIKQEPNRIINSGAVGQQLQMIPIKLTMDLADVTININCRCKNSKVLKVLSQGLCGGNGVDGGKPHDDLVQKRCILHTVESVLVVVGEQPCLSLSRK